MFESILLPFKVRYSKDREYYKTLRDLFGIYPNNIELYKLALIHRSASLFLPDGTPMNNERLEFLGDAVLESVISDFLFIEFPEQNEGFLTQMRSKMVSRQTLNQLSVDIGLSKHIISQGGGNFMQKHIYGDALEAMVGAIYLDKGYDFVNRLLINNIFRKYIDLEDMMEMETDSKSRLLEWGQKMKKQIVFDTVQSPDSTHNLPVFMTSVLVNDVEMGHGEGQSKKEAEQKAAHEVLEQIKHSEK